MKAQERKPVSLEPDFSRSPIRSRGTRRWSIDRSFIPSPIAAAGREPREEGSVIGHLPGAYVAPGLNINRVDGKYLWNFMEQKLVVIRTSLKFSSFPIFFHGRVPWRRGYVSFFLDRFIIYTRVTLGKRWSLQRERNVRRIGREATGALSSSHTRCTRSAYERYEQLFQQGKTVPWR